VEEIILFDFDRTLLDTDSLKVTQAQKIADITELSYEQVQDGMRSYIASLASNLDFSPQGYAQHLQILWGINPSDVLKIYVTGANYVRNHLFPEVVDVLAQLSKSYTLGIYSEAQAIHQRLKIENAGILEYLDATKIIIAPRKKEQHIIESLPISAVVIDDDLQVIDALVKFGAATLKPIWLNRKSGTKHDSVVTIHSLNDLLVQNLLH
jgi:FMN phosphatase YigB (HAD superfamily)